MAQSQGTTSTKPPEPKLGQDAIVYLRDLRTWLIKTTALPGVGLTSTQTVNGRTFNVKMSAQPSITPWQIVRAGGLDVDMVDGILFSSNSTTGVPVAQSVTTSTITLPNNATTKIWFKAEVSNTAFATFFVIWTVDTVTVSSGSSLPADTLDLTDIATGAGDVYVEIAEVTTLDGAVTGITQLLSDSYYLVFPLGIDAGPFACPEPAP